MYLALSEYHLQFQPSCSVEIISPDFQSMETSRGGGGLAENQEADFRVAKVRVERVRCWVLQSK